MQRNRIVYFSLIIVTIFLGLMSRKPFIPQLIYPYLGDILYTLMFYWIFGFIWPKKSSSFVLVMSVGICYLIELSQLIQQPWILEIRNTRLGGLVLGFGFLWSDIVSYLIGGLIGFGIERKSLYKSDLISDL